MATYLKSLVAIGNIQSSMAIKMTKFPGLVATLAYVVKLKASSAVRRKRRRLSVESTTDRRRMFAQWPSAVVRRIVNIGAPNHND